MRMLRPGEWEGKKVGPLFKAVGFGTLYLLIRNERNKNCTFYFYQRPQKSSNLDQEPNIYEVEYVSKDLK